MRRFAQLFAGRADCYGIYRVREVNPASGKHQGKGTTYPNKMHPDARLTEQEWANHLSGVEMLGVVPVLPDGSCNWFAIDIDDYKVDHGKLISRIEQLELPLVCCRSKSGGAHVYCFMSSPGSAKLAIEAGKMWAAQLGYPKSEVFPKQADPGEGIGNWINLPYFGGDQTERYAYGLAAERLSLAEFEQFANAKSISPDELKVYLKKKGAGDTEEKILAQSPPCIVSMMSRGVEEGGRNTALVQFGVYYQKVYGKDGEWENKVAEAAQKFFSPPLKWDEINQVIKNLSKTQYQYLCDKEPMCSLCDKEACVARKFGVGDQELKEHYGEIEIQKITKINSTPPLWIVLIDGSEVKMDTETLLTNRKFKFAIANALNKVIPSVKQHIHDKMIAPVMNEALVIEEAPDDISVFGQVHGAFREWVENWIPKAKSRDDLSKGMPFYEKENRTIIFRGEDLQRFFYAKFKRNIDARELWTILRDLECFSRTTRVRGKVVRAWFYPLGKTEPWFNIPEEGKF